MRKHLIPPRSGFDRVWRKRKGKGHVEMFVSPSDFSQEIWNYVLAIGIGRCPPGYDDSLRITRYGFSLHYVREGELAHTLDNRIFVVREGGFCLFDTATVRRQQNTGRKTVHLNAHHFSRKFRQEVGMAPIQYLYHFRVEQAKRLLADTDRPVGEVACLVGIPDQRYFARLFQKHTGESPHAFRKKEQQEKAPGKKSGLRRGTNRILK